MANNEVIIPDYGFKNKTYDFASGKYRDKSAFDFNKNKQYGNINLKKDSDGSIYDGIAGLFGMEGDTLEGLGKGIGGAFDLASGLFGGWMQYQGLKNAEEQQRYVRKNIDEDRAEAAKDKAEFKEGARIQSNHFANSSGVLNRDKTSTSQLAVKNTGSGSIATGDSSNATPTYQPRQAQPKKKKPFGYNNSNPTKQPVAGL